MSNKYTEKEIDDICWYYGQYKDNLSKLIPKCVVEEVKEIK